MKRLHLFEFEDLSWFPTAWRNYGTDFLQFGANTFDIYKAIVPVLVKGLEKSGGHRIIDLASGGGGGWLRLAKRLKEIFPDLKITLTDYYPNVDSFKKTQQAIPDTFEYEEASVNAMQVPAHLKGMRTQFLSLHHFKPEDAKQILQNAIDSRSVIGVFEAQQRNAASIVPMLLSPLNVIFSTPFIKPFKPGRLLFTYLIPVVPLFILWDGVVSVLRTYTEKELLDMCASLRNGDTYEWEAGVKKEGMASVLYLLGYPKEK